MVEVIGTVTREPSIISYISTGKKGVMYTLWTQITVPPITIKDEDGNDFTSPGWIHHNYIKNLSMTESAAISKAKTYAESHRTKFLGIWDAPYNDRASWLDRWGIHFQSKKKNGRIYFMGKANSEFWEAWKLHKEQIKKEGFWVSKYSYMDRNVKMTEWFVFYRPQQMEKIQEKT